MSQLHEVFLVVVGVVGEASYESREGKEIPVKSHDNFVFDVALRDLERV